MRFLWLLFFLLCLPVLAFTEAKRQSSDNKMSLPPPPPAADKKPKNSVPSSGGFSTKVGHNCTWDTSGEGVVNLLVSCRSEEQTYWCRYAGQPDLCQAYSDRKAQVRHWKQLVGKLKKRRSACDGEKVLKTRSCKAPMESHMKLKEKGKGGGKKDPVPLDPEMVEKEEKKEEKKEDRTPLLEERDGEVNDMEPVENYCAEGWHSVCSFFVSFFEG
ncbi:fibroblast growth factor-binding protein 1 [Salmo trutta]|uniref:fibroblast growth factor-binding protein 1 n=1 Tax=Salmo trutta TaxID=8032 RepID=UPI001131964E|nr:fibroblast growth factor-binding protein 1-like [Salmo trutta]XP_029608392.1 fibroblast growth factor-binding protein 1-like [Salmo trutta]XP_029608393.1 fibroblast growth factor-binding protein 1-like [Salmo trutta]